jgi:hypothetical protein
MITCKICGGTDGRWAEPTFTRMKAKSLCFTCNFWDEIVESIGDYFIINGNSYCDGGRDAKTPASWRGFGGRKHKIKCNDGRIVESVDLWTQGPVPENFKNKLKDNAEFIRENDNG